MKTENYTTMNILFMISKNDKYGAQRIFLDQVSVLDKMGHNVTVVCRGNDGFVTESVKAMGVRYFGIAMTGIRDIAFLRRFVVKNHIDVIHTTLDRADYIGIILSKLTGIPIVSTMMVPRCHIGFKLVDVVVVLSNKQRDLLVNRGIKPQKIKVIRPGIDVERFANPDPDKREAWRRRLNTDQYSIIFCHISSMIPRKAHAVSIDIAAECKMRGENPLLIIIGDPLTGEYYKSIQCKIKALGLEQHVAFTGWTSDVPEILSLSHFTLLPSENEALGVVLMEGMAAGTPIIAREGEGGAEVVEEYASGFLYSPEGGPGTIADKIVALGRDKQRFYDVSALCRRSAAEQFSMQRFGQRLSAIYERLKERA